MFSEQELFTSKQISMLFNVNESTLRRWCIELKKNGYIFTNESNKSRSFGVRDIMAIVDFKMSIKTKKRSLEETAAFVASKYKIDTLEIQDKELIRECKKENNLEFILEKIIIRQNDFEEKFFVLEEKFLGKMDELINKEQVIEVTIKGEK